MTEIGSRRPNGAVLEMNQQLALQTRLARNIVNEINRNTIPEGFQLQVDDLIKEYKKTKPRTRTPRRSSPCAAC
jgi:hypothetical protein